MPMLAGIACVLLSSSAALAAPESAAQPSPQPGTQWIYEHQVVTSDTSERPQKTRLTVLSTNGSIAHCEIRALDTGKTEKFDFDYARYAPVATPQGHIMLKFPLKPGDQWKSQHERFEPIPGHPEAKMKIRISESTKVNQWETIHVPAGDFRALRVSRTVFENVSGPGIGHFAHETAMVYWYAPWAGRVVRQISFKGNPTELFYSNFDDIVSGNWVGTEITQLIEYRPLTYPYP
jgi:hypothetical protein